MPKIWSWYGQDSAKKWSRYGKDTIEISPRYQQDMDKTRTRYRQDIAKIYVDNVWLSSQLKIWSMVMMTNKQVQDDPRVKEGQGHPG